MHRVRVALDHDFYRTMYILTKILLLRKST